MLIIYSLSFVYFFFSKQKLLDDGTGRDPLKVHNFGKAASYLFRPCRDENGNPDEECDITYTAPVDLSQEDQEAIKAIRRQ